MQSIFHINNISLNFEFSSFFYIFYGSLYIYTLSIDWLFAFISFLLKHKRPSLAKYEQQGATEPTMRSGGSCLFSTTFLR